MRSALHASGRSHPAAAGHNLFAAQAKGGAPQGLPVECGQGCVLQRLLPPGSGKGWGPHQGEPCAAQLVREMEGPVAHMNVRPRRYALEEVL